MMHLAWLRGAGAALAQVAVRDVDAAAGPDGTVGLVDLVALQVNLYSSTL